MLREKTGAIIIGAGVVGLACARALSARGIETVIVERHGRIGEETSSRSSEVIHAGLYYPSGSLKAALCVSGRQMLYRYCESRNIPHRRCGKLIVATAAAQEAQLAALQNQAQRNGVTDTLMLGPDQARELEPGLDCVAALHSPSTGIVDSHAFMHALLGDALGAGAQLALRSEVRSAQVCGSRIEARIHSGDEEMILEADMIVNAAGLSAPAVAARIEGLSASLVPTAHFAKGNYYALAGRAPFSRLIYPVPEPGGLGVHLTLDLAGRARFGPDVEWIPAPEYSVDPARADAFYAQIRKYWPELPDGSLSPSYCGVRPKIAGPGEPNADFLIQGRETHGIAGLVNLYGIESPGLTASLAIADEVLSRLDIGPERGPERDRADI